MSDDFEAFLSGGNDLDSDLNPDVASSSPSNAAGAMTFDNINLDEIDETASDFPLINPGWYPGIGINCEAKMSSNNNPMMVFTFEMQGEHKGRQMFYNMVLNKDSGLRRLKKAIIALLGEDFDFRNFNPGVFAQSGAILGKPCMLRIKVGTYQGKANNSVTDVAEYKDDSGFPE